MRTSKARLLLLLAAVLCVGGFVSYLSYTGRRIPRSFSAPAVVESHSLRSTASSIRFSPDSKYLLVAGSKGSGTFTRDVNGDYTLDFKHSDKRLRLWDVSARREIDTLPAKPISNGGQASMLLMPNFRTLLTSWGAWDFKVVDVRKRLPDKTIKVRNGVLASMDVSPDGKVLALGMTSEVQFRDARTYRLLRTYQHGGQVTLVNFGPNSRIVRCSWGGMQPHFVDVKTAKRVPTPRAPRAYEVTLAPDGKHFAQLKGRNLIELWQRDAKKSRRLSTLRPLLTDIHKMQFSPDGKVLAVAGLSSTEAPVQFFNIPARG